MRRLLRVSVWGLAIAVIVLGVMVLRGSDEGSREVVGAGDVVDLSGSVLGTRATVVLPRSEIDLRVGPPISSLGHAEVDSSRHEDVDEDEDGDYVPRPDLLVAPEGGRLVPVTWRVRAQGGFTREDDPAPTTITLVAGEQEVELWSARLTDSTSAMDAFDLRSAVVGVDGEVGLDDLRVEVEFDGLVQTVRAATGEVDAGVAQALDDPRRWASGCEDVIDDCDFVAARTDQQLRPSTHGFISSGVQVYPYDGTLGWAEEGRLWAATRIQVFGGVAYGANGRVFSAPDGQPTHAELDGEEPVLNELDGSRGYGRIVFSVPEDAELETLVLRQDATLNGTDRVMPVRAEIALR